MKRRIPVLAVAIGLTLAACGTSDPAATSTPDATTPASAEPAPATDSPAETSATDAEPGENDSPVEPPAIEPSATQPAAETPVSAAPATDPPVLDPPVSEPPPAEPEPAPLGGRALATSVEPDAQFDSNPFPDLVVDDVGRGGAANVANILPSERPVLLWTWAPH